MSYFIWFSNISTFSIFSAEESINRKPLERLTPDKKPPPKLQQKTPLRRRWGNNNTPKIDTDKWWKKDMAASETESRNPFESRKKWGQSPRIQTMKGKRRRKHPKSKRTGIIIWISLKLNQINQNILNFSVI